MGRALQLSAHRNPEARKAGGCGSQVSLTNSPFQRVLAREELERCYEQGPCAVVGGTGQRVLLPLQALTSPAGQLLPRAAPGGILAHRWPCPYWPPLSSLIWTQLSPWSLGQRHFWKHRCQWRPQQLQAPGGHCLSLWKTGQIPRGAPPKATAGRAGPSGTSPLCFSDWRGCQADARQTPQGVEGYCISWQVHSLSRSCHSLFLLRAARCILKMSHPGCNVNNAEGRSSCWGKAGMSWEGSCLIPLWQ